ncbi:ATP-binding cassette domain-containing protein [Sphingobium sufflavum]|uniref:ABC-F family ATP-binding cassette domain-containing protein n=1 Tax=Sphingobium sufflavum TaxID=1129547 RepID=UPI001F48DEF2|nr:ABC-F family ATP-binding cassette domain-containing protein [Sphingobium sufflavum]MCE7795923.1 ATP-binding cassette domain-containing protein [Sphingobium sufflavum]
MPAFLTLDSLSAATPDRRSLFDHLTLSVGAERVGLVGRNGAGKSTLLHIVAGAAPPLAGTITHSGSIGMLAQDWPETLVIGDALGVADALAILDRIVAGEGGEADFATADWTLEERITGALAQVGLPPLAFDRAMGSLSGGERMRIGIARLLIEAPDLLLLDEPTNNLDADGRAAIMALVRDWRGGLLVASHDRALLDSMDRIVELTPIGVRVFGGNWSAFAEAREAERALARSERDRTDADLRTANRAMQHQREVKARRDKAGRVFAASGSAPEILLGAQAQRAENSAGRGQKISERLVADATAKAADARAKVEVLTPLTIALPSSGVPSHADLLALDVVTVSAGDRVLGPWTFSLRGPDRVAIAGPNGAGKTSLLRIATGALTPRTGTVRRVEGRIALLDQHVGLLEPDASILANFRRLNPSLDEQAAHAACARFAFRNRDALQEVGSLSGGERLRAGLACVLAGERPPWLLLLDEPTNHLDMDSVAILEQALRDYDGGLMVVSHDEGFLAAIGIERRFRVSETGRV